MIIDQDILYKMLCDSDDFYLDREIYSKISESKLVVTYWITSSLESCYSETFDISKYNIMLSKYRNNKLNKIG